LTLKINNMRYFLTNKGITDENGIIVGEDGTPTYIAYYKFLKDGGTLEVIEEEMTEEVPEQITALQFFTQLRKEGITKEAIIQVLEYLKSEGYISQEIFDVAIVAIDKATVIERNNDLLPLIGSAFEKSKEQLDLIFINASKL